VVTYDARPLSRSSSSSSGIRSIEEACDNNNVHRVPGIQRQKAEQSSDVTNGIARAQPMA